ncbi:hypothetical protein JAAARDRAFT_138486 [Jaapia argillacea MUCL 33604]|uniref:Uncharacterized protein n=1 Tax=Jaapia argillacea MUCL 33604 TaxID=933084 RepID=A0A067PMJ1_9AGAM|nr:hypothetical protein JAAARDRAFT_138486 [Jaapia argillacea MUCL 33604]
MSDVAFPSPVGGVPIHPEFAPSILFDILYGILIPIGIYRLFSKHSRTSLIFGTWCFTVERCVIFSLRAAQSHGALNPGSHGLAVYMQITIGTGLFTMMDDLVKILRCILVNSTRPEAKGDGEQGLNGSDINVLGEDQPRQRAGYRGIFGIVGFVPLAASVPGIVAGSQYTSALSHQDTANRVMQLRYASSATGLFILLAMASTALYLRRKNPRIDQRATRLFTMLCSTLAIPLIYRLCVMHNRTTSLTSTSPSSLNTGSSKATFYVFHMIPELAVATFFLVGNVRKEFQTGAWGDYKRKD